MESSIGRLIEKNSENSKEYKPVFYRLSNFKDETAFRNLLNSNNGLQIHDEIQGQVEELVKSLNPKIIYSREKLANEANDHFGATLKEKYGVWVYYKWSNKL